MFKGFWLLSFNIGGRATNSASPLRGLSKSSGSGLCSTSLRAGDALKLSCCWLLSGFSVSPDLRGSSLVIWTPSPLKSPGEMAKLLSIETASFPRTSFALEAIPSTTLLLKMSHLPCPRCFTGSNGASEDLRMTLRVNCLPLARFSTSLRCSSAHRDCTKSSA